MKRLLFKALFLAAGLSPIAVSAQELNFRAVAPRSSSPTSSVPQADPIPIGLSRPQPAEGAVPATFRAKASDEGSISPIGVMPIDGGSSVVMTANASGIDGIRFVQGTPPRMAPLPPGSSSFSPPPPQLIAPPPTSEIISGAPPTIVQSPPMTGGIVSGVPIVGGGPVMIGDGIGGDCACGSGGFIDDFYAGDECGCGQSCFGCRWRPFAHLRELFCPSCGGCCDPRTGLWVRGEFLLWNATRQSLPALVTQAPNSGALPLGSGGQVIYGNNKVPDAILNGGRVTLGFWFPRNSDWGMDASYFSVGGRDSTFSASSNGTPALGRPFINTAPFTALYPGATTGVLDPNAAPSPVAEIVAQLGTPGAITIDSRTQFWGVDANLRRKLCCSSGYWLDGLIGYRHFELQDSVNIREDIGALNQFNANGTKFDQAVVVDSFGTRNIFNGAQVGLEAEWRLRPRMTVGGYVKVAAGNVHQVVNINGYTTIVNGVYGTGLVPGAVTQQGGLLAQGTNIGQHSTDRFAILPEFGLRLGFDITPHWRIFAGYNILYLSNVVRAGEQIDLRVNRTQLPFSGFNNAGVVAGKQLVTTNGQPGTLVGSPTPAVLFRTTDFWAQGVSFGMEYRY